jgi:hypothetical protein
VNITELDALISEVDPARGAEIPSGSSAEARWRYAQLTAGDSGPVHRRRHIFVAAGIAASLVLASSVALVVVLPSGPPSAAAAVLEQAAASAAQQPSAVGEGQYLYTETQSVYDVTLYNAQGGSGTMTRVAGAQFGETDQAWTDQNGLGSVIQTDGTIQFASAADEAAWNANPSGPSTTQNVVDHYAEAGGAYSEGALVNVSTLPTDPSTLATVIANAEMGTNIDVIPPSRSATFERAAALLVGPSQGMTPALASALFEVLAAQPDVELLGTTTDHNGQQGDAVALPSAQGSSISEVIVDATTGSVLEVQFALPAAMTNVGGMTCVGPKVASTTPSSCQHAVSEAILGPAWTDVVANSAVNSNTATVPSTGSLSTTLSQVPGPPGGLTASGMQSQVALTWAPPTEQGASPVSDYVVYLYNGSSTTPGPAAVFDTHSTSTHYNWSILHPGSYTFTVRAVNGAGYGIPSIPVTAIP